LSSGIYEGHFREVQMNEMDLWKLCDRLTVTEAALLTINVDAKHAQQVNSWDASQQPKGFTVVQEAIARALEAGIVRGNVEVSESDFAPRELHTAFSLVEVESLKEWLIRKEIEAPFFDTVSGPAYLDPEHSNYSSKLAAAVTAWGAVTSDPNLSDNGKTAKQNIENWLTSNAATFGLVKKDGELNNDAIEKQIGKVVNWADQGGAPATPNRKPATPAEKPLNSDWKPPSARNQAPNNHDDDSQIPF
jgi:hypothetical protein